MSWLFDTQLAIYAIAESQRLSVREQDILAHSASDLYVSLVTIWEVAIKNASPSRGGKDPFPMDAVATLRAFQNSRFQIISIEDVHVCAVENLAPIHRDPFDRLIVAQAKVEKMTLVTRDKVLNLYFR